MTNDDQSRPGNSEDVKAFGRLVRKVRSDLRMTQGALAAAVFSNPDRKSHISDIELGKNLAITLVTVRSIAEFLGIDAEQIPESLRWPEAIAVVESNKAKARVQDDFVKELLTRLEDQARKFNIKEGMLITLAQHYAEGTPNDFDAAYAGLKNALEVAWKEREKGRLPSNISDAVDVVIARIDTLNDGGNFDAGQAVLDAELKVLDEEDERRQAARARLYEKGVAQAVLRRDVANACRFVLAGIDLETSGDPLIRFNALRSVQDDWYVRGRDQGLNFELEVAIALARASLAHAANADQRGTTGNNLGNAHYTLGERESGSARLEEAIDAYRATLEEWTRERVPLKWAGAQNNLGSALQALGERESGTARLEEAVAAYRAALEEWTRERVPLQWATTQNNLGIALRTLGERESGTARLEEAVAAYRAALEEWTRDRVPLDWAMTQNNLGKALRIIGERQNDKVRLKEALAAIENAHDMYVNVAGHTHYEDYFHQCMDEIKAAIKALEES
ncbi:MAG: tetratricopeptide repeat protein [Rhodobacterales bacterium]|nr:tetratricopeptide repeat protein [Rhodobacterales bacterium]